MLFDVQAALSDILNSPPAPCDSRDFRNSTGAKSQQSRESQPQAVPFDFATGQPKPSAPTPSQDANTPPLTDTGRVKTFTGKIVSLEEWRNLPEWEQRGPNGRLWCGICREWVAGDSPCPSGICGKGGKG